MIDPGISRSVKWPLASALALAAALLASVGSAATCTVCEPAVRRFGTEAGLSHNAVVAIAQDRAGYVWLATRNGLDRLDGSEVRRFDRLDRYSLRAERVTALAADPVGGLWIGLRDGLLHRDRAGAVRNFDLPASRSTQDAAITELLAPDAKGVWVGRNDGLVFASVDPEVEAHALPAFTGESIRGLQWADDRLHVLSAASSCVLRRLDAGTWRLLRSDPAPCLHALAVVGDGLWRDPQTRWQPGQPLPPTLDGDSPRAIVAWHGGHVFAGLRGAVWRGPDGEIAPLWRGRSAGRPRSIDAEVLDAHIDIEGGLWLATYDGAFRLDPAAPALHGIAAGAALRDALRDRPVSDLLWSNERWWVGSFGHGLLAWNPVDDQVVEWRSGSEQTAGASLCDDFVWDLLALERRVLVNADCAIDADGRVGQAFATPLSAPIRDSLIDASGRVWLATLSGLHEWVDGRVLPRLPGAFGTLTEGPPGQLWLVPALDAVHAPEPTLFGFRVADGALQRYDLPQGSRVYDLTWLDGRLWLASGLGLLEFDRARGHIATHVPKQPQAGSVMYSLQADAAGQLWVGSNRGLLRFNPAATATQRFRHFDQRDGLAVTEFNRRSRALDAEGRVLLGGIGGIVRFDPTRAAIEAPPPMPLVSRVRIWNRDGERAIEPNPDDALLLNPGDLAVTLEFSAPGFRRAGHAEFRYRLAGFDPDWIAADAVRSARYPRLAPGDYRFELMAGSDDAGWRVSPAALALRSLPAWYQQLRFRVPALLLLLLLVWWLYRWRVGHLLQLERLRTRIAADLHDELGSELAAIGISAAMLGAQQDIAPNQRRRLQGVAESAERVAEAMRDIVWYVNPDKDRMQALGERLLALARRLFGEERVVFESQWNDEEHAMPMAVRRELLLICREALTNIQRHAGASRVQLRLERNAHDLTIRVADDGCGFSSTGATPGNGLTSMARRAAAIGANFTLASSPGQGTRIAITLPHPHLGARHRRRQA